jgi:hypothetical protein
MLVMPFKKNKLDRLCFIFLLNATKKRGVNSSVELSHIPYFYRGVGVGPTPGKIVGHCGGNASGGHTNGISVRG